MSFRIEKKIFIKKEQLLEFKKFLLEKKVKKLHDSRKIESVYFENRFNQVFFDSMEGLCPRKKIRVRTYPEVKIKKFYLEYKISSVEGRYKINNQISNEYCNKLLINGIFDKKYGSCLPKLTVNYNREYLKKNDVIFTIDTEIEYNLFNSLIKKKDPNIIVELKTNIDKNLDELFESYPFQETRFSKYCNGLQLLNVN